MTPDELLASMPYATALGIEIDRASADEVTGRLAWAADRCTVGGAMREGQVEATSRPLHAGRTTIVVQTDLVDATSGRRVAQVTQTQAVIRRE